jgi:hypothetical protein
VVHRVHAQRGINCLECHRPAPGQDLIGPTAA